MNKCLLVMDVQESFRHREFFDTRNVPEFLDRQNALIAACEAKNIPIVRIFHTTPEGVFSLASGNVVPLDGLIAFDEALCIYKQKHSALVGTALPVWLVENHIEHMIISGIRTEQCCETTTRHASDLGYQVTYALDATLTFDMPMANGEVLTAEMIHARTQTVLQDRFANVIDTDSVIRSL